LPTRKAAIFIFWLLPVPATEKPLAEPVFDSYPECYRFGQPWFLQNASSSIGKNDPYCIVSGRCLFCLQLFAMPFVAA